MNTSDFGCTQKRGIVLGKLLSSNNCIIKMKVCNIKGMLCLYTCSRFFLVATLLPGFFSFFSFDSRNLKRVYPQSGWWVVKRRRYMYLWSKWVLQALGIIASINTYSCSKGVDMLSNVLFTKNILESCFVLHKVSGVMHWSNGCLLF